jgi:hypothetical protein
VVAFDGYVEAIFGKKVALGGEALAGAVEEWESRFGFQISSSSRLQPDGFAIRLSGAGERVVPGLRDAAEQFLASGQADPHEPMEVRYVYQRRAYFEPLQWLPVDRLLGLVKYQSMRFGRPVELTLKGNALCLSLQPGPDLDTGMAADDAIMTDLTSPTYTLHTQMSGGISDGVAWVRMTVPSTFLLRGSRVPKLDFVRSDPPPRQSMHGSAVTLYLTADPMNAEQVWHQGALAALEVGVYPVGDFPHKVSRRLTHVVHPLTLTGR